MNDSMKPLKGFLHKTSSGAAELQLLREMNICMKGQKKGKINEPE